MVRKNVLFLGVLCSFPIFLFLLNPYYYWDGLGYRFNLLEGHFNNFFYPWDANGRPLFAYLYYFLGNTLAHKLSLPGIYIFRATVVASLFAQSWIAYRLLTRYLSVTSMDAFFVACIAILYPAMEANLSFSTSILTYSLPFLFGGLWLGLKSEELSAPWHSFLCRVVSLFFLLLACVAEATLPLVFFVGCLLVLYSVKKKGGKPLGQVLFHLDFFAVPSLYYVLMSIVFEPYGIYAASRSLDLNPLNVLHLLGRYILEVFPFFSHNIPNRWVSGLLIVIAIFYIPFRYLRTNTSYKIVLRNVILLGLVVLLLGILPMLLAVRIPNTHAWDNRHFMLVAVPVAMILVASARLAFTNAHQRISNRFLMGFMLFMIILSGRVAYDLLIWQSRGAFDQGIISHFKKAPVLNKSNVIYVDVLFKPVFNESYRPYEFTGLFQSAANRSDLMALTGKKRSQVMDSVKEQTLNRYATLATNRNQVGALKISQRMDFSTSIGMRDLLMNLFSNKRNHIAWQASLVTFSGKEMFS